MNLENNPDFMKRMENAVDFSANVADKETTTNIWPIIIQAVVIVAGAYLMSRLFEHRRHPVIYNSYHYHQTKEKKVDDAESENKNIESNS